MMVKYPNDISKLLDRVGEIMKLYNFFPYLDNNLEYVDISKLPDDKKIIELAKEFNECKKEAKEKSKRLFINFG